MASLVNSVTATELAQLAGVEPSAVSNWRRRNANFPHPLTESEKPPRFDLEAMIAWLATRRIPADSRQHGEPEGITYGQRVQRRLTSSDSNTPFKDTTNLAIAAAREAEIDLFLRGQVWPMLDRHRGAFDIAAFSDLIISLLCVRLLSPDAWRDLRNALVHHARDPLQALSTALSHLDLKLAKSVERIPVMDSTLVSSLVVTVDMIPFDTSTKCHPASTQADIRTLRSLLDRLAELGGKKGSEFSTPYTVADLMVRLTNPGIGDRILDPCCSSGNILAATHTYIVHQGAMPKSVDIAGIGVNESALRIAMLQLLAQGANPRLKSGALEELIRSGTTTEGPYDVVLSNPPFSYKPPTDDWTSFRHWSFGEPPRGSTNLAWVQHAIAQLSPEGRAAILLQPNAAWSERLRESEIRRNLVHAGLVEALIALPAQLFYGTSIPVTLWLMRSPSQSQARRDDAVLFIDATSLGKSVSRTQRVLTTSDVDQIVALVDLWRARPPRSNFVDASRLSRSVPIAELMADGNLNPVTRVSNSDDAQGSPQSELNLRALIRELSELGIEARRIDQNAQHLLGRLGL